MKYNWELADWPEFSYSLKELDQQLTEFILQIGEVNGLVKTLSENIQQETRLELMLVEAIKTSEIEGEYFSREDIMSSLKNNLKLNKTPLAVRDKRANGISSLMVDVHNTFKGKLTNEKLFEWHKLLFSTNNSINVGTWRKGSEPMQVVSGRTDKIEVHFEAPPSKSVPSEMKKFIKWFNETASGAINEIANPIMRAGIAHLYFESIHPFEDGNGRIGRAIAEKALSQTLGIPVLISLSVAIEADKNAYYSALKKAQKSNEISNWLKYFADISLKAQKNTKDLVSFTLKKAKFFDEFKGKLNARQVKSVNKMFDAGLEGFEGGMTAQKYISITGASKATATRDLKELETLNVLISYGGGRNTHYNLNL
nr:Fic family protein [Pedobacter sp. ASV2]